MVPSVPRSTAQGVESSVAEETGQKGCVSVDFSVLGGRHQSRQAGLGGDFENALG
jgi:hypothetical protein